MCQAMKDKLGRFRDKSRIVARGNVIESFISLSIVDSKNGAFNRVRFECIHEDVPNEFAVIADARTMNAWDIISAFRANRNSFRVGTGLAKTEVWVDVLVEVFGMRQ